MLKLFRFLRKYADLFLFLILQAVALWLVFSKNSYQSAWYFNTSNAAIANGLTASNEIKDYFRLRSINEQLAAENAQLKRQLTQKIQMSDVSYQMARDTSYAKKYDFTAAKVINNSTANYNNFITINKGLTDSVLPGMGVISYQGIVGKVRTSSEHFSTVISLLHHDMLVSSRIKRLDAIGSVRWEGPESDRAKLMFIPRHREVKIGDTVVTSGYNTVFPDGEMVGVVENIRIKGDESFYNISIKLSTDFNRLSYVYVVRNRLRAEQDSLEAPNNMEQHEKQ